MKKCELCKLSARMYCESDQASLCWDCDSKVHSANFLVARHSRSLLCRVCQSQTPWTASGAKLGHTVTVCDKCVQNCNGRKEEEMEEESTGGGNNDDEEDQDSEGGSDQDEDDSDDEVEDDGNDEEDGENQVVPLSSTPPPPLSSSTSSEESSNKFCSGEGDAESSRGFSLKRLRENADLDSPEDLVSSSFRLNNRAPVTAPVARIPVNSFRPLIDLNRTILSLQSAQAQDEIESRSAPITGSLKIFRHHVPSGDDASLLQ